MSKVLPSEQEAPIGRKKLDEPRITWPINLRLTERQRDAIRARFGDRGVAGFVRRKLFEATPELAADAEGIPRAPDEAAAEEE